MVMERPSTEAQRRDRTPIKRFSALSTAGLDACLGKALAFSVLRRLKLFDGINRCFVRPHFPMPRLLDLVLPAPMLERLPRVLGEDRS